MRVIIFMLVMLLSVNESHAQVKKVFISGSVTVENLDDCSDVSIIFNKTVPDEKEYSVSPEVNGKFSIEIEEGIYDVAFTREFCEDVLLEDINMFDNKILDDVTLIYLGEYLYGSIEGVIEAGVYDVREDLIVESYKQLIIEPGTTLKFAEGVSFRVEGEIVAGGTESERIIFTSIDPDKIWTGLKLDAEKADYGKDYNIILEYLTIEKSNMFSISAYDAIFNIDHLIYQNNHGGCQISFSGEDCYLKNSIFTGN
ncbi:MAG: hypothetical protein PF588_10655, partial [Candidatus Kapabacteria bacterium]|nr:hypothetical protein [Candidatus Kapabacteria bacterium]